MNENFFIFISIAYALTVLVIVVFAIENKNKDVNFLYAGFWLRLGAFVIDNIFIALLGVIPFMIIGELIASKMTYNSSKYEIEAFVNLVGYLILNLIGFIYFSIMESSKYNATLGKKLLGIIVVDLEGNSISFARASGRFFAKFLSTITLLIGYFMAGSTKKKQALHDILAGCLVVYKNSPRYLPHATPLVAETPPAPVEAMPTASVAATPSAPAIDVPVYVSTDSIKTSDEQIFENELLRRYKAGEISDDVFLQLIKKK